MMTNRGHGLVGWFGWAGGWCTRLIWCRKMKLYRNIVNLVVASLSPLSPPSRDPGPWFPFRYPSGDVLDLLPVFHTLQPLTFQPFCS